MLLSARMPNEKKQKHAHTEFYQTKTALHTLQTGGKTKRKRSGIMPFRFCFLFFDAVYVIFLHASDTVAIHKNLIQREKKGGREGKKEQLYRSYQMGTSTHSEQWRTRNQTQSFDRNKSKNKGKGQSKSRTIEVYFV